MANLQNDIFENQDFAAYAKKYWVTKQGEITCTSINSEIMTVGGETSLAFTQADKDKLATIQTAMAIKGTVATKEDLPTDALVGDVYLVGAEGSEDFAEYVCVKVEDGVAKYESLGSAAVSVSYNPTVESGTELGTLNINGSETKVFAPTINNGKLTIKMDGETRATFTADNVENVVADLKSSYVMNTVTSATANLTRDTFTVVDNPGVTTLRCSTYATAQNRCHEYPFVILEAPTSITVETSTGDAIHWMDGTDLNNLEEGAIYIGSVFGDLRSGYFGIIRKF